MCPPSWVLTQVPLAETNFASSDPGVCVCAQYCSRDTWTPGPHLVRTGPFARGASGSPDSWCSSESLWSVYRSRPAPLATNAATLRRIPAVQAHLNDGTPRAAASYNSCLCRGEFGPNTQNMLMALSLASTSSSLCIGRAAIVGHPAATLLSKSRFELWETCLRSLVCHLVSKTRLKTGSHVDHCHLLVWVREA